MWHFVMRCLVWAFGTRDTAFLRATLYDVRRELAQQAERHARRIEELESQLTAGRESAAGLTRRLAAESQALKECEGELAAAKGIIRVYESDAVMLWKVIARHQARIERETAEEHLGRVLAEQKLADSSPPPEDEE